MRVIEEVAGLVLLASDPIPPPTQTTRLKHVARAPVMLNQRPIPANAPTTEYLHPLTNHRTATRNHHNVAGANVRPPIITPRC